MMNILLRWPAFALALLATASLDAITPSSYSLTAPLFPVEFEQSGSNWVARGPGYQFTLENGDASLSLSDGRGHAATIGLRVVGRQSKPIASPEREMPGIRNYLIGSDRTQWRTNVRLWEQVRFAGVLNGVDLVYHGSGRKFEYDLVVAPGASASSIGISLTGAAVVKLEKSGALILHTAAGDVVQNKPLAYQMERGNRREVAAAFRVRGRRIGFLLGAYDHSQPLIIDPVVDYATWFPGKISNVIADASGSAYIAGQVWAPNLPVTSNAYQPSATGTITGEILHLFVAKFSPDGSTLVYCTYLSGSGTDTSVSMAVDSSGNLVVGGTTTSPDFPLTAGSYISKSSASSNSFLSKLSADGSTLLWSTLLPTTGLTDVGLDGNGNVFALCTPSAQGVITTPNAIASKNAYRWLGEIDPTGALLVYATYVPGLQATAISGGMTIRQDGTVWIAGTAPGADLLDYRQCVPSSPATPVNVIGIDPVASAVVTSFSFGGSQANYGTGLQFDAGGNMYLSGFTCSPDFPGVDTSIVKCASCVAGFLVKLPAGSQTSSWTITTAAWPLSTATDAQGNSALLEPSDPNLPLYYFDTSGSAVWNTLANSAIPIGPALAMDSQGRIYVASDVPSTMGAWASGPGGSVLQPGLMRIEPNAGSLLVMPQTLAAGSTAYVFAVGGTTLPLPFTVSTTTPWLQVEVGAPVWGPSGTVIPLPGWLYNTPAPGSVPSTGIMVSVDPSANLQPGSYAGTFTITAPGFANSPLTVPVNVVIGNSTASDALFPPEVVIFGNGSHSSIGFGTGTTISSSTTWIVPIPSVNSAFIDESSLPAGVNVGHITVTASPFRTYPITVDVIEGYDGTGTPRNLVAGPGILSFLAQPGDAPKHATVAVWPSLSEQTPFTATAEAPWLAASPGSGAAPTTLTVTANPSGLQPGAYTTHIDITSPQAANGTVRIPVTLTVQNDVAFNVDPAGVGIWQAEGSTSTPVQFDLTSNQPMTYQAVDGPGLLNFLIPQGTTPGQLSINFGDCTGCQGAVQFTTGGNNIRDVPVVQQSGPLVSAITPGGVVNDATFSNGPVAPGSIVAVFGTELAASNYVAPAGSLPNVSPPTNSPFLLPSSGDQFGIYYWSPTQWNLQVPTDMAPGPYWLLMGESAAVPFTVAAVAPYIFNWGSNHGSILNADNSLNTPQTPAAAGSAIQVYLTGQGAVNPQLSTRQAATASQLSYVAATTTATIDGAPVNVPFSGMAPGFVGLCQVNVAIPNDLSHGQHKLVINIGGVNSNEVIFDSN